MWYNIIILYIYDGGNIMRVETFNYSSKSQLKKLIRTFKDLEPRSRILKKGGFFFNRWATIEH